MHNHRDSPSLRSCSVCGKNSEIFPTVEIADEAGVGFAVRGVEDTLDISKSRDINSEMLEIREWELSEGKTEKRRPAAAAGQCGPALKRSRV